MKYLFIISILITLGINSQAQLGSLLKQASKATEEISNKSKKVAQATGISESSNLVIKDDEEKVREISDYLANNAKRNYDFKSADYSRASKNYYIVSYTESGIPEKELTDKEKINMQFHVYYEGENTALEVKGTPIFTFKHVKGRYLDIFPFWKKYIDPNADAETIATSRFKESKTKIIIDGYERTFVLKEIPNGELWEIKSY